MIIGYAELKVRGQLHDNSCKKNGLNNSVPSVSSVLGISSARTKKTQNPKNLQTKTQGLHPPLNRRPPPSGVGGPN